MMAGRPPAETSARRSAKANMEDMMTTNKTEFFVTSGSETKWNHINAKTLRGAKQAAGRMYRYSVGGNVRIAVHGRDDYYGNFEYVTVAIKYGFDRWMDV
jgi:hypothetical protein